MAKTMIVLAGETVVCERCELADSAWTRLRGLMGRGALPTGEGLMLRPAASIHTCFMRFPIDAIFLDADLNVVGVREGLRPWRMAGARGARAVLELPAGESRSLGLTAGLRLALVEVTGDLSSANGDGPDGGAS
jgi:uncharacterized membrane protein (UPF0127 family)